MMILARRIKFPNVVSIKRPHHADASEHCRAAKLRNEKQRFHRGLPFRCVVLGLWQLGDVLCRIPERDELATAQQGDRIVESALPIRHTLRPNANRAGHPRPWCRRLGR
jgi:hypothetical protein